MITTEAEDGVRLRRITEEAEEPENERKPQTRQIVETKTRQ